MSNAPEKSNVLAFAPGLIVDCLERLLAQSEAGQIQGFCFVSMDHEGAVLTNYFGVKRFTQLGGLARLQHEINSDIDNGD